SPSARGPPPRAAAPFVLVAALGLIDIGIPAAWRANFALAFWFDAATFLVSFAFVRGIADLRGAARAEHVPAGGLGSPRTFTESLRIPLIRAVIPATLTAALGVGALFSLGIRFVRDLWGATNAEFGA